MGIFYAPERGENTRHQFTYQLGKYLEKSRILLQDLLKNKEFLENRAKEDGKSVIQNTKERVSTLAKNVDKLMEKIKNEGKK